LRFRPLPDAYIESWRRYEFPYAPDDFETLNVSEYSCPLCHCSDRERIYALWISRNWIAATKLLDVGPSKTFARFLKARFDYQSLDIEDGTADTKGDVQSLPFPDDSFDAFICSHVLEHVADDVLALQELRRVLRPSGWGIVMVPICVRSSTVVEDTEVSETDAWRRFAQGDHVRLYNRCGFLERLDAVGFRVNEWRPAVLDRVRFGLARGSVLYVVSQAGLQS
jgi:SAM-dependent methyltransferase